MAGVVAAGFAAFVAHAGLTAADLHGGSATSNVVTIIPNKVTPSSRTSIPSEWDTSSFGDGLFEAKAGNHTNEYSRAAQEAARTRKIDPCDYLRELYRSTHDRQQRQKIKTAQKALGCRHNRTKKDK